VQQRNKEAMMAVMAVVAVALLVGVIVGAIVAWRRSRKLKKLDAESSSASGEMCQPPHASEITSCGQDEKAILTGLSQQAFPQTQYQAQPVYSMMPNAPMDEKASAFPLSPCYDDAPPAYTSGSHYNPGPH
jgi:cell division protein FtsN